MKNLSNFKIIIKTREYLIQAIYQMLFSNDGIEKIISQFKNEHKNKKVDFKMFSTSLKSIEKNKKNIEFSGQNKITKIITAEEEWSNDS